MPTEKNPFTSKTFTQTWFSNFQPDSPRIQPGIFKQLSVYKSGKLPLFISSGRNLTKGITYRLSESDHQRDRKKVFLIYDVPDFLQDPIPQKNGRFKCMTSRQYPGFLIDLKTFESFGDYFTKNFSKKSRYKFRKYKKRLETCFDINYRMYYGETDKEEYGKVFEKFRNLLVKRFKDKQIFNNNLKDKEWSFYEEVVLPMILDKEASLFVIYNGDEPIAVTLLYYMDSVMIDAITVFDIDYSKFHLGSVMVMKLLEWAFENEMEILDFSKGEYEYKKHWMTHQYDFHYHIWYDSSYLPTKMMAYILTKFYDAKQFVRKKNINETLHKFVFTWKYGRASKKTRNQDYEIVALEDQVNTSSMEKVQINQHQNQHLRKAIFDILYLNQLELNKISLFKHGSEDELLLESNDTYWRILL